MHLDAAAGNGARESLQGGGGPNRELWPRDSVLQQCGSGVPGVMISVSGKLPRILGLARAELIAAARLFARLSGERVGETFRDVTVIVQDDAASDEVHRAIMGVEGATDVITQRYEAIPPEPPGVYGEIYVNAERAVSAAPKRKNWSPAKEFLLYVAHGFDHLSGADDHTPSGYAAMRRRELSWLRQA